MWVGTCVGRDPERALGAAPERRRASRPSVRSSPHGKRDTRTLLRLSRDGEAAAREHLVTRFLPLARTLALRYRWTGIPLDDLTQVAAVGLLKAIDGFDPDRGSDFGRYAIPTITGELKRCVRDSAWLLHVPRTDKELLSRVRMVAGPLSQQLGRQPSVAEMGHVGVPPTDVAAAHEAAAAYAAVGLDSTSASGHRADAESQSYAETIGADDERYGVVEFWAAVRPALRTMTLRDRRMLYLRCVEGRSQAAVARELGISQVHVSRLLRTALARLQEALNQEPVPAGCSESGEA